MASYYDRARFYTIAGTEYPSVTTILQIINKPALGPWYAKQERQAFETALLEVAAQYRTVTSEQLVEAVIAAVNGVKAADREKQKAAAIGTAAHAMIEWRSRKLLGEKVGPEPRIPDAALLAVMAWEDWAKAVQFTPLVIERVVYCADCGYAGTLDWIAKIEGSVTLGDYKTGKAIYGEAFLQNVAYRHAARKLGLDSDQGMILRLPKVIEDPAFEAMVVPDLPLEDFLAALHLWRWQRGIEGKPAGTTA